MASRFTSRVDPYLVLLLVLSGFVLTPLWAPGYFYTAHDGRHSVFYLIMFDASVRDGAWWPRWAMHHIQGYGYPTFVILAPLGFYVAEVFVLLGAGYTLAAKLTWAVAFLASAWGMYRLVLYWLEDRDGAVQGERGHLRVDRARLAALIAGLVYVYAPYHLADIYVRGALNDTLLLAWFPWVFLAFDRLVAYGTAPGWSRRLAVAILLLAGALLTHSFALISFAPLLVTFVIFRLALAWRPDSRSSGEEPGTSQSWRPLLSRTLLAGTAGGAALLLYAVFLLPLLLEGQPHLQQQVYVTNTYDFRNHFVHWGQFFSPFWGFGYSDDPVGANDGMSFQVGLIPLLLTGAGIYLLARRDLEGTDTRAYLIYLIAATLALLAIMAPVSAPLWESLPVLAVIQFPWRLLALVALTTGALAGLVSGQLLALDPNPVQELGGALLFGLVVILASFGYIGADLQPVEPWREDGRAVFRFEQEHPDMIAYTEWVKEPFITSPMTPDYAAESYVEDYGEDGPLTRLAIVQGSGEVISNYSRGSSAGGVVRMTTPGVVRVHLLYFPGWQVQVDKQPVSYRIADPHGLIEVDVPAGEHRIDVRMGSTPVRRLGSLISAATLAGVLVLLVWPVRRPRGRRR